MNKFEKLIEYIINDEDQKARELFHDIVVEKSRDIYESIMDEESMEENVHGDQVGDMVDEISNEESVGEGEGEDLEGDEQGFGGEEEFGDEEGEEEFGGADAGEHAEIEDQVMNIDAKLDELLAKFDEIMGGEEPAGDEFGGEEPAGELGGDEFGAEQGEEEMEAMYEEGNPFANSGKSGSAASGKSGSAASGKSGSAKMEAAKAGSAVSGKSGSAKSGTSGKSGSGKKSTTELMREYVDRIGDIYGGQGDASEGDAVGSTGKKTSVNTKPGSVGPGADFGGTTSNIVSKKGATNENPDGKPVPKANNEYTKGQGEIKSGNRNVPGGKADNLESTGQKYETEHGKEGQTTDGSVPVAKKSVQKQNTGVKR